MAIKHNVVQNMTWVWGCIGKECFPSTGAPLIDCQPWSLAPPFNSGANTAPVSMQTRPVQCHYSVGTDVGRDSLETTGNRVFDIMSHMWD